MTATPEHYEQVTEAVPDLEQFTVLTVAGSSRQDVAAALGADLSKPVDPRDIDITGNQTAWALLDVPGGVLAVESSGFGDPSLQRSGHSRAPVAPRLSCAATCWRTCGSDVPARARSPMRGRTRSQSRWRWPTGVTVTADHVSAIRCTSFHRAPAMKYAGSLDE